MHLQIVTDLNLVHTATCPSPENHIMACSLQLPSLSESCARRIKILFWTLSLKISQFIIMKLSNECNMQQSHKAFYLTATCCGNGNSKPGGYESENPSLLLKYLTCGLAAFWRRAYNQQYYLIKIKILINETLKY